MRRFDVLVCAVLLFPVGAASLWGEETLDTLLPPPGWLRRQAVELDVDLPTRQRMEQLYQEREPRYHQLKYKVERLANQLRETLVADELDEALILKRMDALLKAENELKLYQVHVRITLLSQVSHGQRQAAQKLAQKEPPATNWRGGIAGKVDRIRELGKRLKESGASVSQVEQRMREIDKEFADGNVAEGMRMLDQVIHDLETTLGE